MPSPLTWAGTIRCPLILCSWRLTSVPYPFTCSHHWNDGRQEFTETEMHKRWVRTRNMMYNKLLYSVVSAIITAP